jgi:hypothetical protein
MAARSQLASAINLLLGIWLVISAFAWPHSFAEQTNTWIVGAVIAIFSAVSFAVPEVRWLDSLPAVWLFFSTFALTHGNGGTVWHNVVIAVAVFTVAFAGAAVPRRGRRIEVG